jgi:hypothetical protein
MVRISALHWITRPNSRYCRKHRARDRVPFGSRKNISSCAQRLHSTRNSTIIHDLVRQIGFIGSRFWQDFEPTSRT